MADSCDQHIAQNVIFCWIDVTLYWDITFGPQGQNTTFWYVRPTKTQISLCIRAVWSESSMSI